MDEAHRATALAWCEKWVIHFVVLHETNAAHRQLTGVHAARILHIVQILLALGHLRSIILQQLALLFGHDHLSKVKLSVVGTIVVPFRAENFLCVHSCEVMTYSANVIL